MRCGCLVLVLVLVLMRARFWGKCTTVEVYIVTTKYSVVQKTTQNRSGGAVFLRI